MRLQLVLAQLALAALIPCSAMAQTGSVRFEIKDGSTIVGTIISRTTTEYRIRTALGDFTVPVVDIVRQTPSADSRIEHLRLHGSNTVGEKLAPRLLEGFAAKNGFIKPEWSVEPKPVERTVKTVTTGGQPGMTAEVHAHGSSTAFTALKEGRADIGMSSRQINTPEVTDLYNAGFGTVVPRGEHVLALDGLAVIVSGDNKVGALSVEQIARIFAGEITDWKDVGGEPGEIKMYARDDNSGTYDTFRSLVLNKRTLSSKATRFESSSTLSDSVAGDRHGIGFISLAYVRSAKALALPTSCGITTAPDLFDVRAEEYQLSRRLYLYTPETIRSESVKSFVNFALSPDAQPIVSASEYVDLTIQKADAAYWSKRIATTLPGGDASSEKIVDFIAAADTLKGATRLSLTFRFDSNAYDLKKDSAARNKEDAHELDSRAQKDLERLTAYLALPENAGREVILAGFADSVGSYQFNKRLSKQRAETILKQLGKSLDGRQVTILAASELMPVACNTSDAGLAKNRRVEVWLR